ncbi:hypothetical protein QBC40DRAFT_289026 [Triangularia verruculosa]|uniref:Uncharacterized protein n=1 Tax=Triangularia verruculosa TaxID=2587418 RepID=A0AAN6XCW3_9PEZI|nr:hypothetical protein QBC40DRAFT_289026 [Triangularia verruculosa]
MTYNSPNAADHHPTSRGSDEALEVASITLVLGEIGASESGYHIFNDPKQPFQRSITVDHQRGVLEARCRSREVVHGRLFSDSEEDATLLVYDISLDTTKRSRRITKATVEFEFRNSKVDGEAPRVHALAPEGRERCLLSNQEETVTYKTEGTLEAGPVSIVNAGLTVGMEKMTATNVRDDARVTGGTFCDKSGYDRESGARWRLTENPTSKSGVPSHLRCAILLAREDNTLFEAKVTIKLEADWKSELGRRLAATSPPDDPVLFNPKAEPTNMLCKTGYDTQNLGRVDLQGFVSIRD